jgi:hypothetical protein
MVKIIIQYATIACDTPGGGPSNPRLDGIVAARAEAC